MTIPITQKHIDEGERKSCQSGPVALAIRDATGVAFVRAYPFSIHWGHFGMFCPEKMKPPPAVREFMDRYDSELPVEPISFELEAAA